MNENRAKLQLRSLGVLMTTAWKTQLSKIVWLYFFGQLFL